MNKNDFDRTILNTEADFKEIIDRYAPMIARRIKNYGFDAYSGQDVLQEILMNYWQAVKSGAVKSSPTAYLYGLVRNTCSNYKKLQKSSKTVTLTDLENTECYKKLSEESRILEEEERERQMLLKKVLDTMKCHLSDETFRLITRSKLDDISYSQLSNETGQSESTLRKKVSRGLIKIRNLLS